MVPGDSDGWTWDDDYNPRVLANAALAAREPGPSPRAAAAAARAAAGRRAPTVITRLPEHLAREVTNNGVLLVDKPLDWTALDVVNAVKPAVKARRAGFAGSLDPGATGLLIVCLGHAASLAPRFTALPRTYSGTLRLGVTTATDDATGALTAELPWRHVTDADLAAAARGLTGEIMQLPHMWSGTKVNGRPLRWYAERGQSAPRTPRAVLVESLDLWRDGGPDSPVIGFRTVTAKGANVRALVADLGAALGCGAHIAALRREAIGGFSVDKAWTLDVFIPMAKRFGRAFRAGPPGGLDGGGGGGGGGGAAAAAALPAGGGGGSAGMLPRPPQ